MTPASIASRRFLFAWFLGAGVENSLRDGQWLGWRRRNRFGRCFLCRLCQGQDARWGRRCRSARLAVVHEFLPERGDFRGKAIALGMPRQRKYIVLERAAP